MPEDGVPLQPKDHMLTTDEIVEIGKYFNKWGVDKIRLTGGEPLVNRDIGLICREFGHMPNMKTLAITTNGLVLVRFFFFFFFHFSFFFFLFSFFLFFLRRLSLIGQVFFLIRVLIDSTF